MKKLDKDFCIALQDFCIQWFGEEKTAHNSIRNTIMKCIFAILESHNLMKYQIHSKKDK